MTEFVSSYLETQCLSRGADLYSEKSGVVKQTMTLLETAETGGSSRSISGIDLKEYLEFAMSSGKEVVVTIDSDAREEGRIFLMNGDLVHATCGDLQGEQALLRCLDIDSSEFRTGPIEYPTKISIHRPGEEVLLEVAGKKEESLESDLESPA
jgi:hypothetical protein